MAVGGGFKEDPPAWKAGSPCSSAVPTTVLLGSEPQSHTRTPATRCCSLLWLFGPRWGPFSFLAPHLRDVKLMAAQELHFFNVRANFERGAAFYLSHFGVCMRALWQAAAIMRASMCEFVRVSPSFRLSGGGKAKVTRYGRCRGWQAGRDAKCWRKGEQGHAGTRGVPGLYAYIDGTPTYLRSQGAASRLRATVLAPSTLRAKLWALDPRSCSKPSGPRTLNPDGLAPRWLPCVH